MAHPSVRRLEVRLTLGPDQQILVGTLGERDRRVYFEYDDDWLTRGLELSPFTLAARPGLIEHTDRAFGPLPGLFDDSLPDGWGLLLMDRHFRQLGIDLDTVSALDRLAYLGTQTMGALTYHPPSGRETLEPAPFDLHDLARQARAVHAGPATEVLPQLLRAGGSPGGARPKVLVGHDPDTSEIISGEDDVPDGFEHWIVKFPGQTDAVDAGAVEYAYSLMARAAGLRLPRTRIFATSAGDRFFGVKRFDRADGNRRFHIHTFGNLIHADFRVPGCDYADLLKATRILTRDQQAVLLAYRLMAFNVLAHNRDDHVKNFSYVMDTGTGHWDLAPAYDLTFAPGPGGEHSTTVDGEGREPTTEQMLRLAGPAGIGAASAREIIDEVRRAVVRWPELADQAGVSVTTREVISSQKFPSPNGALPQ